MLYAKHLNRKNKGATLKIVFINKFTTFNRFKAESIVVLFYLTYYIVLWLEKKNCMYYITIYKNILSTMHNF